MNIDNTMKELAEYIRMGEEIAANIDALKDALKQYMRETGVDSLTGTEYKASYKAVVSSRIDTTALKKKKKGRARNSREIYPYNGKPPLYIRII